MPTPDAKAIPRRGQRDAEATKEALLTAGMELFAERGFTGARVEAIARRAGINKAMINYYFGGKVGLYDAILASTFRSLRDRLRILPGAETPAADRLRRFIELFSETALERPLFPALMIRELMAGGDRLQHYVVPRVLEIFAVVRDIVEQGIREGDFRPVHPLATHMSLVGSLFFFFVSAPGRRKILETVELPFTPPNEAEYIRHVQDLFAGGLAARSEEEPSS